jgi:TfoX/Sxy family transcriptional regulator of competence genes
MKFQRSDKDGEEFLLSVLPPDPRIKVKPMFGNRAAFVNGNMFAGLYGRDMLVRLPEEGRTELLREKGASVFEPVKGRVMKEYIIIPRDWRERPDAAKRWVLKSLEWVGSMPAKSRSKG